MKIFTPLLPALMVGLLACQSNTGDEKSAIESEPTVSTYSIAFQSVDVKQEGCTGSSCTYVSLKYPALSGGNHAEKINQTIEDELREILKARLPEPTSMGSWNELAQKFIDGYALFMHEFPDTKQTWFLKVESSKSILTEDYFTAYLLASDFMGGAHSNTYAVLLVFDLSTGERVDVKSLVDIEMLTMLAEKKYREIHKLKADEPLDDSGYFFPGGIFALPANLGMNSKGVLLVYNPYEVAAYSKGMTEFVIPYTALRETEKEST